MKGLDFTLGKYQQLCKTIVDSGYEVKTVRDYLAETPPHAAYVVILRHDVDRKPERAVSMAVLERDVGLSSTYYFRSTRGAFKEEIIKKIDSLNHEIGYHYETLSRARGDYHKAFQLFQQELLAFRKLVDVRTICMHGAPLSVWDNRWLWRKYDFRQFQISGEAYLSIDYSQVAYLTDTGRAWNADKGNIRDRVYAHSQIPVQTTDELMEVIKSKAIPKMCIQTHPERWDCKVSGWLLQFIKDNLSNLIKPMVSHLILDRRRRHNRVKSDERGA